MYVIVRSFFYDKEKQAKTKIVRICIVALLLFCFLIVSWGSFIESNRIVIKQTNLNYNQTVEKETLKIAFVSDTHVGPYKKNWFLNRVVDKIISEQPDIVLLGGDYILSREKNAKYLEPFKRLSAKYPTFAVTGNHEFKMGKPNDKRQKDRTATLRKLFAEWNIPILDNQTQIVETKHGSINITGIPDIWTELDDLEVAKLDSDPEAPKILLAHNPSIILDKEAESFDLVLSGHTHAGQIRLPWIGPLATPTMDLDKRFDQGIFKLKNGYLYITAGLGESGARARLFNPPEITILNLDL